MHARVRPDVLMARYCAPVVGLLDRAEALDGFRRRGRAAGFDVKPFVIAEQPRLGFLRTVRITVEGIRYRSRKPRCGPSRKPGRTCASASTRFAPASAARSSGSARRGAGGPSWKPWPTRTAPSPASSAGPTWTSRWAPSSSAWGAVTARRIRIGQAGAGSRRSRSRSIAVASRLALPLYTGSGRHGRLPGSPESHGYDPDTWIRDA